MTTAATLVLVPSFFGTDLTRTIIVATGMLVLQLWPRTTLLRDLARPVTAVASASLEIYLSHLDMLPLKSIGVRAAIVVASSLAVGIGVWWAGARRLSGWRARTRADAGRTFLPRSEPSAIGVSP